MRRCLFNYVNKTLWFEGTIEKFSLRYQKEKKPISIYHTMQFYPTVLISKIKTIDDIYIHHLWSIIPINEEVIMRLKIGNRIKFKAIVEEYRKRHKYRYRDVGINNIRCVKILGIDHRFENKERIDFLDWWIEERHSHNITKLCFKYDDIVLHCRYKKFTKTPRIKEQRKVLNENENVYSFWSFSNHIQ